jgi:RHS repeat-associated protein
MYDCPSHFVHFGYRFTGKERDTESGNDYFEARYYSSAMGRFMSPDWSAKEEPVPYAKLDNPQTLNLYAYMRNNPLGGTDPDGHCCDTDDVINFLGGAMNAFGSDNALGAGRQQQTTSAGKVGAAIGDFSAAAVGAGETLLGSGGEVVGGALDATGVGAIAGVPINIVSTAAVVQGSVAASEGVVHLAKDASQSSSGTTPSSAGKMQKEVEKGQAPKSVDRVDKGRGPNEKDHVHFADGSARNQDGSWKHGASDLSSKVKDWLGKHGWN